MKFLPNPICSIIYTYMLCYYSGGIISSGLVISSKKSHDETNLRSVLNYVDALYIPFCLFTRVKLTVKAISRSIWSYCHFQSYFTLQILREPFTTIIIVTFTTFILFVKHIYYIIHNNRFRIEKCMWYYIHQLSFLYSESQYTWYLWRVPCSAASDFQFADFSLIFLTSSVLVSFWIWHQIRRGRNEGRDETGGDGVCCHTRAMLLKRKFSLKPMKKLCHFGCFCGSGNVSTAKKRQADLWKLNLL